jgi:hypothetical protein
MAAAGAVLVVFVLLAGCVSDAGTRSGEDSNLQSLEFTNYMGVTDLQDTFLIMGTARNTGDLPIQSVRLRIDYQDGNHTVIASRVIEESVVILPNESWNFEFPFTDPVVPDIHYSFITPLRIEVVR